MSYRFMRVMVFYDLPSTESEDRSAYSRFHKYLLRSGFVMMQESVYCKLALNMKAAEATAEQLRRNKPEKGLIQLLCITEKQFARMEFILGEHHSDVVDTDERLVVL